MTWPTVSDLLALWQAHVLPRLHALLHPHLGPYAALLDAPQMPGMLGLLVLLGVILVITRGSRAPGPRAPTATVTAEPPLPRVGGQSIVERLRSTSRFERPLTLFGRSYESREMLIGIASIPGTGKSTILADLMWRSGDRCILV